MATETIAPRAQEQVEKAITDSLKLVRAFKMIIQLKEGGLKEFLSEPMESFADIETIIHQNHLDQFWKTWSPYEATVRREQGQESYFTSYVRESTLDLKPEVYRAYLDTIVADLEEIRELSHSNSVTDDEEKKSKIKGKIGAVDSALRLIRLEFGTAFATYIPENANEIPLTELVFDEIIGKLPEESVNDKDRRIDRRKDVLQIITTQIGENVRDIRKILGIESAVARVSMEPVIGAGGRFVK